jgi:hypothetical protein
MMLLSAVTGWTRTEIMGLDLDEFAACAADAVEMMKGRAG